MAKAWHEVDRDSGIADAAAGLPVAGLPVEGASYRRARDWRQKMSDTIAYALLVYTALQIFVTMSALKSEGGSLLPYLALIILVAAIIPSCRRFERRWNRLSDAEAADPALARWYRRDCAMIWGLAIGLPFAITGVFHLLGAAFS